MSFPDKGFWTRKSGGHLNPSETVFNDSSRENKRPHQWLSEADEPDIFPSNKKQTVHVQASKQNPGVSMANSSLASPHQWLSEVDEPELFPSNKKQAVQASKQIPGISMANSSLAWEINPDFQSLPNPFIDRLFSSDANSSLHFSGQNMNQLAAESSDSASVGLSMSYPLEDGVNYGGISKVKGNQVKDSENGLNAAMERQNSGLSLNQAYNREAEAAFMSVGQAYDKEGESVTFDPSLRPLESTFSKGSENAKAVSFGGYQDEQQFIESVSRPISSYDLLYNHSSLQATETLSGKEPNVSNGGTDAATTATVPATAKSKPEPAVKFKSFKREAANCFPSNVRSLMATGMLDGVPVRYVSSREDLRGMIKGSGYLCGCNLCNYSKALSAYEFECHAGCKTKHPNNHIYLENGKTIYQIVQELRSTPESQLFDAIHTVIGSPLNQKAFRIWKESFQAATRELQRIYGKDLMK